MSSFQSGLRQGSRRLLRILRLQQNASPLFSSSQRSAGASHTKLQHPGLPACVPKPVQDREIQMLVEIKRWPGSSVSNVLPVPASERLCNQMASFSAAAPNLRTKEGRPGSPVDDKESAAVEEKVEPVSSDAPGETGIAAEEEPKTAEVLSDDAKKVEELRDELDDAEERLAKSLKTVKEMEDRMMRSIAAAQNMVDRVKRESEAAKKFAVQSFAKDLLDVGDNLSRAAAAVPKDFADSAKDDAQGSLKLLHALLQGVEMTEKQLLQVFKKHGLEKYDPIGQKFDPNVHSALFEVDDSSKEAGTVAVVVEAGYKLHDRVIRAANVGVVKARAEAEATAD